MAKRLDCLERRRLLNSADASPERMAQLGREFAAAGYLSDAVDFLEKAGDTAGLAELLPGLMEEGDVFLFSRVKRILAQEVDPAEWLALAEQAARQGKEAAAARARARAGPAAERDE